MVFKSLNPALTYINSTDWSLMGCESFEHAATHTFTHAHRSVNEFECELSLLPFCIFKRP